MGCRFQPETGDLGLVYAGKMIAQAKAHLPENRFPTIWVKKMDRAIMPFYYEHAHLIIKYAAPKNTIILSDNFYEKISVDCHKGRRFQKIGIWPEDKCPDMVIFAHPRARSRARMQLEWMARHGFYVLGDTGRYFLMGRPDGKSYMYFKQMLQSINGGVQDSKLFGYFRYGYLR